MHQHSLWVGVRPHGEVQRFNVPAGAEMGCKVSQPISGDAWSFSGERTEARSFPVDAHRLLGVSLRHTCRTDLDSEPSAAQMQVGPTEAALMPDRLRSIFGLLETLCVRFVFQKTLSR